MSTSSLRWLCAVSLACAAGSIHAQTYGFGTPASAAEIRGWNIEVSFDGRGLPSGAGSVAQGKAVYERTCAACHGMKGEGKPADRLVGGRGTLATPRPVKTVGSFWPYATTIFDYVRRAMPYDKPQSLTNDEVYAVTAYLLHLNGIVPESAVMNAQTLPKVEMPNRNGFTADTRPDLRNPACRVDCL